ncbi:MAG TPA: hypothetical protein VKW04_15455 [Planctomycetota bacterium]|nr:hypothetical protein [Planctomycetota bacterium]
MREAGFRGSAVSLAGCSLLALVTLTFTVMVEYRNWKADHYLPSCESDGPWRMPAFPERLSLPDQARAELRGTVVRFGLPLYLLCPLTILWAAFASARSFDRHPAALPVSMACLAIGIMSTILITSLHVLESLG